MVPMDLIFKILESHAEKTFRTLAHSDRKLYFALKQQTFAEADVKLLQINFLPVLLCIFQRFLVNFDSLFLERV